MAGAEHEQLDWPRSTSEIWIADMVHVISSLGLENSDNEKRSAIAGLLGMDTPEPLHQAHQPARSHTPSAGAGAVRPKSRPRLAQEAAASPRRPADEPTSLLTPLSSEQDAPRVWGEPMLQSVQADQDRLPLPYQSLLPPSSEAATLHVLLSRTVPEGPVDLERLVDRLAGNLAVESLPRLPVRTLRFGVQVLVDLGEGMEPFLRDEMELVDRVAAIAGRHGCQVRYFSGCPLHRSGEGAGWTWKPYRPPAKGAKVLVLSDFGRNGDTSRSTEERLRKDWQKTARIMRRSGCPAVALAPVPQKRIPAWVSSLMPVMTWDRSLTTAQAQVQLS
ncbi:hypothetical protein [Streptomyces parvulus]|uniref:hypothetical protein n=1 Tax=Streptomyces parvulus TaxID=146923 RepID=UPI001CFC0D5B|nr:hypothetical protein [Streptomyces parvulus]